MEKVYINKKEYDALHRARNNTLSLLEICSADETMKEYKEVMDILQDTLDGLSSIINKYKASSLRTIYKTLGDETIGY